MPGLRLLPCNALIHPRLPGRRESMTQLCHRHGISRKTGYKWLSRFNPGELSSLENLSAPAISSPIKSPPTSPRALFSSASSTPTGAKNPPLVPQQRR